MRATAILHVRNEEEILRRCFDNLLSNGLAIAVIDNQSDDRTAQIVDSYTKSEIPYREVLEFNGFLDLPNILQRMQEVVAGLDTDWILYVGADEIPQSARAGETLLEGMARIDAAGFTAINFQEIVFVPTSRWIGYEGKDYVRKMRYYYFHQPRYPRLMRAWKNLPGVSNVGFAGHLLDGEAVKLADEDWILRHYIMRSFRQVREKYANRKHSPQALARGWHWNRAGIDWSNVRLPPKKYLKYLPPGSSDFDLSDPWPLHFWLRHGSPA